MLSAISIHGSHFTLKGSTWTGTNMSLYGITEPVHAFNADFLVSLYWTVSGRVYELQQSSPKLIGTISSITNAVLIAKGTGSGNIELLSSVSSGFNPLETMQSTLVNATDISCTMMNQSCWYLEGQSIVR